MSGLLGRKGDKNSNGQPITSFSGYYQFLGIDFQSKVYYEGFIYPSVTVAFQAARTNDISIRRKISQVQSQEEFKKLILGIKNAEGWNEKRVDVMMKLNRDKFKRNKDLGMKLFATQNRQLVNGYGGGSQAHGFWGMVQKNGRFEGLNTLGKVLHEIRQQMKNCTDFRQWVEDQKIEKDKQMWPEASIVVEKEGSEVDNLLLTNKSIFLFGSHEFNEFKLEHSSISKFHASVYFSADMEVVLVDLNSTNGTKITRDGKQIILEPLRPESLENRDVVSFGMSSRMYHCYFGYEEVEKRMAKREEEAKEELSRIDRLKQISKMAAESVQKSRQEIKSLLQLKRYACLYVDGVTRAFPYQAMKQIFNRYGPVKNIRISIDKKTGRYMGSALIYFQDGIDINDVLGNIATLGELPMQFRTKAVFGEQADNIIASFGDLQRGNERKELEDRNIDRRKRKISSSRSRSREHQKSRSSSSQRKRKRYSSKRK